MARTTQTRRTHASTMGGGERLPPRQDGTLNHDAIPTRTRPMPQKLRRRPRRRTATRRRERRRRESTHTRHLERCEQQAPRGFAGLRHIASFRLRCHGRVLVVVEELPCRATSGCSRRVRSHRATKEVMRESHISLDDTVRQSLPHLETNGTYYTASMHLPPAMSRLSPDSERASRLGLRCKPQLG